MVPQRHAVEKKEEKTTVLVNPCMSGPALLVSRRQESS